MDPKVLMTAVPAQIDTDFGHKYIVKQATALARMHNAVPVTIENPDNWRDVLRLRGGEWTGKINVRDVVARNLELKRSVMCDYVATIVDIMCDAASDFHIEYEWNGARLELKAAYPWWMCADMETALIPYANHILEGVRQTLGLDDEIRRRMDERASVG